jgi:hypothetical protein
MYEHSHSGSHSNPYHMYVYARVYDAIENLPLGGASGAEAWMRVTSVLEEIADEIRSTPSMLSRKQGP